MTLAIPATAEVHLWGRGGERAELETVLAGYLGVEPGEVEISRGPTGKPRLVGGELSFNAADSGGLLVVAVGHPGRELGVDVEDARRERPFLRLARRYLEAEAAERIAALAGAERRRAFYAEWTAAEARAKATASGMLAIGADRAAGAEPANPADLPPPQLPTGRLGSLCEPNRPVGGDSGGGWASATVVPFAIGPDVLGAVAALGEEPLRLVRMS